MKKSKHDRILDNLEAAVSRDEYLVWVRRNVEYEYREGGKKRRGEIDLLAWDGEVAYIYEVKTNDTRKNYQTARKQLFKAFKYGVEANTAVLWYVTGRKNDRFKREVVRLERR